MTGEGELSSGQAQENSPGSGAAGAVAFGAGAAKHRPVMKLLMLSLVACLPVAAADWSAHLPPILAVGPEGKGNAEAGAAWKKLTAEADAAALPDLLKAMNGAGELSANWLRGAVSVIAGKHPGALPLDAIKAVALDTKNSPAGRSVAFDLLRKADAAAWDALVPGLLNDPSAELRREPVSRLLAE